MKLSRTTAAIAAVVVLAAVLLLVVVRGGKGGRTLTADFSRSTAVYVGNAVTVLGVTEGTVTSLTPDGPVVHVHIRLNPGVRIPVGAQAAVIAPSLVSSRLVALSPAYTSGPVLPDGAVIDNQHTFVPLEIDEVLAGLQQLSKGLGPTGANKSGALSQFITAADAALKGNGALAHSTTVAIGSALSTIDGHAADVSEVVRNLAALTTVLAEHDGTVRSFETNLATATGHLADDRSLLATALKDLSVALGQLTSLVADHRSALQGDLHSLTSATNTLLAHQKELEEAINELPTFGQNLAQAVDPSGRTDLRLVNLSGTAASVPAAGAVCKLLNVCDLFNLIPVSNR